MQQRLHKSGGSIWALRALALTAVLSALACSGDIKISPTAPRWTFPDGDSNLGQRILDISGDLIAEQGSCFEATVLFDGRELEDARVVCSRKNGCANLRLEARVRSEAGQHTIAFQIVRQSARTVDYRVEGSVLVSTEGLLDWQGTSLMLSVPLRSSKVAIQAGESVSFDIEFQD